MGARPGSSPRTARHLGEAAACAIALGRRARRALASGGAALWRPSRRASADMRTKDREKVVSEIRRFMGDAPARHRVFDES